MYEYCAVFMNLEEGRQSLETEKKNLQNNLG